MLSTLLIRKISRVYLILVPFLVALIGFGVGHSRYAIYIPIWIIHSCLMLSALWMLSRSALQGPDASKKYLAIVALFMIALWIFFTIFAGMGPPPSSAAGWVATAKEQQIRYFILILGGVVLGIGFALLRKTCQNIYSDIGFTAILIALPLFIINMAFWGNFLAPSFKALEDSGTPSKRPGWYLAVHDLFYAISLVELALFYLATAVFAASLRSAGWLSHGASPAYRIMSLLMGILCLLPPSIPEPFGTASYLVSVPAIPFIMPYLMGISFLRRNDPPSLRSV